MKSWRNIYIFNPEISLYHSLNLHSQIRPGGCKFNRQIKKPWSVSHKGIIFWDAILKIFHCKPVLSWSLMLNFGPSPGTLRFGRRQCLGASRAEGQRLHSLLTEYAVKYQRSHPRPPQGSLHDTQRNSGRSNLKHKKLHQFALHFNISGVEHIL